MAIRTVTQPECPICQQRGQPLYSNLRDNLFKAEGEYGFWRCETCDLLWLNPRPIDEDIPKCYQEYYTHTVYNPQAVPRSFRDSSSLRDYLRAIILETTHNYPAPKKRSKLVGRILSKVRFLRERAAYDMSIFFIPWHGQGRLLDVGCGNGRYLLQMQQFGWQVVGVDPDPQAISVCQAAGLTAYQGTLEALAFPDNSFDAITMNHVIEHVPDPVSTLTECYRLLSPGGYLAIATPNIHSLGHHKFRAQWRGLEPPRHLTLFSQKCLNHILRKIGYDIVESFSWSRMVDFIYDFSNKIKNETKPKQNSWDRSLFKLQEKLYVQLGFNRGEELMVLARKKRI